MVNSAITITPNSDIDFNKAYEFSTTNGNHLRSVLYGLRLTSSKFHCVIGHESSLRHLPHFPSPSVPHAPPSNFHIIPPPLSLHLIHIHLHNRRIIHSPYRHLTSIKHISTKFTKSTRTPICQIRPCIFPTTPTSSVSNIQRILNIRRNSLLAPPAVHLLRCEEL